MIHNRRLYCALMLLGGLVLAVLGFFLSAPIGEANPRIDFAPLIFIAGVLVMLSSAIVYELGTGRWPHRENS